MEDSCGSMCNVLKGKINLIKSDCEWLNWKKPAVTGGILALINLFFLAMAISGMNLFTILSYFFLFYVVAGIAIAKFSEATDTETDSEQKTIFGLGAFKSHSHEEYEHISKDQIEKVLTFLYNTYIDISSYLNKINSLGDFWLTAKFYVTLYSFVVVSGWCYDSSLLWAGLNTLFLWRPVYVSQKSKIDQVSGETKNALKNVLIKIDSFIPKYVDSKKFE